MALPLDCLFARLFKTLWEWLQKSKEIVPMVLAVFLAGRTGVILVLQRKNSWAAPSGELFTGVSSSEKRQPLCTH